MEERDYFSAPKDVTLEYRRRAKSLPTAFVVLSSVWVTISLFTVVFGALWQLVCAIVLVAIILGTLPKYLHDRSRIASALASGPILRQWLMDDRSLQRQDVCSGSTVFVERTELKGLSCVHVFRDSIDVSAFDQEFSTATLHDEDFADFAKKKLFLDELLSHLQRTGSTGLNKPPSNPWIGRL